MVRTPSPGKLPVVVSVSIHPLYDTRINNHVRFLLESGVRTACINWSKDGELGPLPPAAPVEVTRRRRDPRLAWRPWRYASMLRWFAREAARYPGAIFHVHDLLLLPLVPRLKRVPGARVVFDAHDNYRDYGGIIQRIGRAYYRRYLRHCDAFAASAAQNLPSDATPVRVVPNFQYRALFDATQAKPRAPAGNVRTLYIGSLTAHDRATDALLDAADVWLEGVPKGEFVLAGSFLGAGRRRLERRVEALVAKHGARMRWLGTVNRAEAMAWTKSADVGLWLATGRSHLRGASPHKVHEYLMVGAAVLASEFFDGAETIREKGAGVLLPPDAPAHAVAEAWIALVADPARLARMRKESALLGRTMNWESVAPRYLELYSGLGAAPPTAAATAKPAVRAGTGRARSGSPR